MNISVNTKRNKNVCDEKHKPTTKSFLIRSRAECSVDRSLALTLQVSRLFGIAPVTFKKKYKSVIVRVSPVMCAYSYLLMFVLHASIIAGLVIDFYLDSDRSVRVRSASASIAWLIEVVGVSGIITLGIYNAPGRMSCMIHCLNVIEKATSKIYKYLPGKNIERTVHIIGLLYLLTATSLYLFDFYTFAREASLEGKDMKVLCLYLGFYTELMATFPLELQFMETVMKVVSAQKAINNALMDLVSKIDSREKRNPIIKLVDFDYLSDNADHKPVKSFLNTTKDDKESASVVTKKDIEMVRYLVLSYGSICDVVRQINDSNAVLLILLILSFFLHLIISPYYLICFWTSTKHHWEASTMLQVFMCIFHTANMMIIVEPAHRSTEEMENTQALLGQLTRRVTSPSEPLIHELDLFYKQIVLNPVSFTPMGICSLTRPIVATIFGGVTTYLVIILQFRALDNQNW